MRKEAWVSQSLAEWEGFGEVIALKFGPYILLK